MKTFKYRIYPTKRQRRLLNSTLNECRWLYNHLLEERKNAWETEKKRLSCFDQMKEYVDLKESHPSLKTVFAQVLQNVSVRLDIAIQAFFRRIKAKQNPGYPRFQGPERYNSFTFPQAPRGCVLSDNGKFLNISKIGNIPIILHRPLGGKPKTATLRRTPTGKWFVTFVCEWEPTKLPEISNCIGVDVGVKTFATLSDGTKIENPKFFKQEQKSLAKAQRKLYKREKGSKPYEETKKVIARLYERSTWKRDNFSHQESRKIVNQFGVICVEDLNIQKMLQSEHRCLNRSISDAAWQQFLTRTDYKAEWAGRKFVKVNPAYTSQICSQCGHKEHLDLKDRVFKCPCCNLVLDRDFNAAKNILTLGLQSLGIYP